MEIKTYIVQQRLNLTKPGQANVKIIAVKLTQKAAQDIVDANPGTWIEKHLATKTFPQTVSKE